MQTKTTIMNTKQISKGHWLFDAKLKMVRVESISEGLINEEDEINFAPIELTHHIIERIGFQIKLEEKDKLRWMLGSLTVTFLTKSKKYYCSGIAIQYLHQLQTLVLLKLGQEIKPRRVS